MRISRQALYTRSRDRSTLLRLAVLIVGVSLLIALSLSSIHRWLRLRELRQQPAESQLAEMFTGADADAESIALHLRRIEEIIAAHLRGDPDRKVDDVLEDFSLTNLEDLLALAPLDPSERLLFNASLKARFGSPREREQGRGYLETHAAMSPPLRFANELLADLHRAAGDEDLALAAFEKEAAFEDADYARRQVLAILLRREDREGLDRILQDPGFLKVATAEQRIDAAVVQRDRKALAIAVVAYDYRAEHLAEAVLALFAALVWFVIVIQIGAFSSSRTALCVLAVLCGVASASATLYTVILQESIGGMNPGGDMIEEIIYFIVGVGLREEVIKFLFFALFTPILLARRSALDALLSAACIGLGFALQENIGYFKSGETLALQRFLTANFFHLGLSGILGLAWFQMWQQPKQHWEEFVATFIGVVVAHGIYDSLLAVPELHDYSILHLIVFVLIARRFFSQAAALSDARARTISPLAVFVLGTALLIGVVINYAAWQQPIFQALTAVGFAVLGVIPIAFVFINQFRES
ncbi:MAG: PrsW family glutamic-type intramembrane protease [Verrucomicrobiales bacterium]